MQDQLRDWLVRNGFPDEIEVVPMRAGFGGTTLWRFSPAPDAAPLVARVFRPGGMRNAERETMAIRHAAAHGILVPTVVLLGQMDTLPVLVTTFASGQLATEALAAHPERASAIGLAMGDALGRLHAIPAPEGLASRADAWVRRGGTSLAPIAHLLATVPDQDRLIHLDYHPNNVFLEDERVTAIIDWENTLPGPPHMDLARTRAILHALRLGDAAPPGLAQALDALETGLVDGHARVIGPDPHAALSAAWGMAMTTDDLASHLDTPGSWITGTLLDRLRSERDRRITAILDRDSS